MTKRAETTSGTDEGMSGATVRARAIIVRAALEILPLNPTASLNEIAERAGVGRSTLHRHFADRDDVVLSLARYISEAAIQAIQRASPEFGEPQDALRRIVNELFDLGPALVWMHENVRREQTQVFYSEFNAGINALETLFERARPTGSDLPVIWRNRVFWEVLRLGASFTEELPRQRVIDMIIATLSNGVVESN